MGTCDRFSPNENEPCRTDHTCEGGKCTKPYDTFCLLCCGGADCDKESNWLAFPKVQEKCFSADTRNNMFE